MGARWVRLGVGGIGLALLVFTVTYEVGLPNVAVAWSLLALASVAVVRRVAPVRPLPGLRDPLVEATAERLPFVAAGLALLFLGVQSLWLADPLSFGRFVTGALQLDRTPFADQRTYVLAILAATIALSGWAWRGIMPGLRGGVTALVVVAWLLPFEIRPGYAVAGWSALALAGFWALRIFPGERLLLGATSCALAGFGAVVALAVVAPPDRLVVDSATTVLGWPLLTDATVALAALAVAAGAGAFLHRDERLSLPALAGAGVALVYLLSVAVVDQFQLQVASRPLEELQKEAQVGLSALWSIVGAAAFATGLVARRPPIRLFGLALLGLATAKVFLVDLAALDVAYRVLSQGTSDRRWRRGARARCQFGGGTLEMRRPVRPIRRCHVRGITPSISGELRIPFRHGRGAGDRKVPPAQRPISVANRCAGPMARPTPSDPGARAPGRGSA